jgi:hypothetical protein
MTTFGSLHGSARVIAACWSAHRCCAGVMSGELCVPPTAVTLRTGAVLRSTTAGAGLLAGWRGGEKIDKTASGIALSSNVQSTSIGGRPVSCKAPAGSGRPSLPDWRFRPAAPDPLMPAFKKLNQGWNAEPNAPEPSVRRDGPDIVLRFFVNPWQFRQFEEDDLGFLRFHDCLRYRLGPTNDEGWYRGQCRYSRSAPAWGEFYEITGFDIQLLNQPGGWVTIKGSPFSSLLLGSLGIYFPGVVSRLKLGRHSDGTLSPARHFLFYFRDGTFECIASGWSFEPEPTNALCRVLGSKSKE